ncbi:MAG: adenylyl-sulfate kinase [Phycisphaerales bacterium]|nr:MAG: adenylyl-sulfate kinase [Phycisphaerales bacterium]
MGTAFTIWFTGMSGSGKSTIGRALGEALRARGLHIEVLDSGRIRQQLNRTLGFSREEVETNLLRLGYECKLLNRNGVTAIVTAVSPYRDVRDRLREEIGDFVEIHCRCPMEVLVRRGAGELFEKARRGEIAHVAGVNAPYEEPLKPEVLLNTDQITVEQSVKQVIATLEVLRRLERVETACYTPEEEEMIRQRLQDLGYL